MLHKKNLLITASLIAGIAMSGHALAGKGQKATGGGFSSSSSPARTRPDRV